jgi:hypothetical protein
MIHGTSSGSFAIGNKILGISAVKFNVKFTAEEEEETVRQVGIYLFPIALEFTISQSVSVAVSIWEMRTTLIVEKKKTDKLNTN